MANTELVLPRTLQFLRDIGEGQRFPFGAFQLGS